MAREAPRRKTIVPLAAALALAVVLTVTVPWGPGTASDADRLAVATMGDLRLADDDEGPGDGVIATFVAQAMAPGDRHTGYLRLSTEGAALDDVPEETRHRVDHRRIDLRVLADDHAGTGLATRLHVLTLTYGSTDLLDRVATACGMPVTLDVLIGCASREGGPLAGLEAPGPGRDLVLTVQLDPTVGNALQGTAVGFDVEATLHSSLLDEPGHPPRAPGTRSTPPGPDEPASRSPSSPPATSTASQIDATDGAGRPIDPHPTGSLTTDGWTTSSLVAPSSLPRTAVARLLVQDEPLLEQVLVPHLFDGIGSQVLPAGAAEPTA